MSHKDCVHGERINKCESRSMKEVMNSDLYEDLHDFFENCLEVWGYAYRMQIGKLCPDKEGCPVRETEPWLTEREVTEDWTISKVGIESYDKHDRNNWLAIFKQGKEYARRNAEKIFGLRENG